MNLAIDQKLPWGLVGTIEGIFSHSINDVYLCDFNLVAPTGERGDGRPVYPAVYKINPAINNAYVIINTNLGYSFFITPQLKKTMQFRNQSFDAMVAYTYSQSKDAYSDAGSTESTWFGNHGISGNPNHPRLAFSDFDQPHKVVGYLKYRIEYAHYLASAISVVYSGYQNGRFNYTYNGDYNGDGNVNNDLIYIPKATAPGSMPTDINLVAAGGSDPRTALQTWNDLNNYINQDPYMKNHRGQIMTRNGDLYPFRSQFDIKFVQDLFMNVGGKRNTLEFSLDILNFGNMLNSNWGVSKLINSGPYEQILNVVKGPVDANNNPPVTFPLYTATQPLSSTFSTSYTTSSTWQLQMGLRYIFN